MRIELTSLKELRALIAENQYGSRDHLLHQIDSILKRQRRIECIILETEDNPYHDYIKDLTIWTSTTLWKYDNIPYPHLREIERKTRSET